MHRLVSTLLTIIMRNENQYKDLLDHLIECNVPTDMAQRAADIVASELSSVRTPRTPAENQIVRESWAIANKLNFLSNLESFRGE